MKTSKDKSHNAEHFTKDQTAKQSSAVPTVKEDHLHHQRVKEVAMMFGTFKSLCSNDEIENMELSELNS